jgi:uncharacterized membrane protein YfcA
LPDRGYRIVVGVVLLYAAAWMFRSARRPLIEEIRQPRLLIALPVGLAIGLLSGLTGVGGGIFLSPLVLYMRWADTRTTSGVAAPFILVNSIAGLAGHFAGISAVPATIPTWGAAVLVGGWMGAIFGSRRAPAPLLRQLLSVVLAIAGAKMILF